MKFDLAYYVQRGLQLRDRRRGRQHPDRRGADAAHHLRTVRGVDRPLLPGQPRDPAPREGNRGAGQGRARGHDGRLRRRREDPRPRRSPRRASRRPRRCSLTRRTNLYDPRNIESSTTSNQALSAHTLFQQRRRLHGQGRRRSSSSTSSRAGSCPGRRWWTACTRPSRRRRSVKIESENQTLATITFQNYFRMYDKLAGMTGTADTEADEFDEDLQARRHRDPDQPPDDPPREPGHRLPHRAGEVRRDRRRHRRGAAREGAAGARRHGVDREVRAPLDPAEAPRRPPRRAEREVPRAAKPRSSRRPAARASVTIATNMAGRGTDILLGGNPEFMAQHRAKEAENAEQFEKLKADLAGKCAAEQKEVVARGGLHILGTERHEIAPHRQPAPRPRGPPGRPGLVALLPLARGRPDADLRVGPHRRTDAAARHGGRRADRAPDGHARRSSARRSRSRRRTSPIRKHLLEYDDVMNKQREAIYALRREHPRGEGAGRDRRPLARR